MGRRVPPLREAAQSSPVYLSADRTQSSSPCSRVRSPTHPTRSFQVCAFSLCEVLNNLLGRDHHFDRFPIIHCPVTIRNAVKADGPIEHSTGLNIPLKNIRQEVLDISTHRSRPAANGHIVVKRWFRSGNRLFLRNTNAPHRATRTSDADCRIYRLFKPDAFQHSMCAVPAGQFATPLHSCITSLTHDVGRAEILGEGNAISMASENNNLLSAQSLRSNDTAQSHS